MTDTIRCPDCGHPNPLGAESCAQCNFPLAADADADFAPPPPVPAPDAPAVEPSSPSQPAIFLRPPRRRQRAAPGSSISLWILGAFVASVAVVFIAVKSNVDRASEPVEGSSREQQQQADEIRAALAQDSTNVDAHVAMGNLLYDTGNWSDAIVHYRAALRRDSTRTPALVDLGVCYYNLGRPDEAEHLFQLALKRDPHQPVALFNLGIVNERRQNHEEAFQYFHRSLQSGPPEEMKTAIMEAMQRIQTAQGRTAPPLPDGQPPSTGR